MKCVGYDTEFVSEMAQKEKKEDKREQEEIRLEEEAMRRWEEENKKRKAEEAKVDAERKAAGLPPLHRRPRTKQTARKSTPAAPKSMGKPSVRARMREQVQRIESEQAKNTLARSALKQGREGRSILSREGSSAGGRQVQGNSAMTDAITRGEAGPSHPMVADAAGGDDGNSDGELSYASDGCL